MTKKQAMGREFFLSPSLYKRELLDLGGKSIWVREPSTKDLSLFKEEGDNLSRQYKEGKITQEQFIDGAATVSAKFILSCICDENGDLIGNEADLGAIKLMPNRIVNAILAKAFTLGGINYKEVEEVAANLKNEGIE